MARVPLINADDPGVDPKAAELLRSFEGTDLAVLNIQRAMVNHPDLMEAFFKLVSVAYVGDNLTSKQAELPYLTSTLTMECFY